VEMAGIAILTVFYYLMNGNFAR